MVIGGKKYFGHFGSAPPNIKNLRPAAGQLVRELAGGQTALANYLGAIPS
jgi:hypothetical protein